MTRGKGTIRAMVLRSVLGVVLLFSLILTALYLGTTYHALRRHIDKRNERVLEKLERVLSVPLLTGDYVMIVDIIDAEVRTSDLDYIWVLDRDGRVIACNDEYQIMQPIAGSFSESRSFRRYSMKNGEGAICILPNYGVISRMWLAVLGGTIPVLIGVILLMVIVARRLAGRLAGPLESVVEASTRIANGDFDITLSGSPIVELDVLASTLVDTSNELKVLTDNLRNEKAQLKASEERFALAMRGANDGLWDWDMDTNRVYYSPRWKEMLGYSDEELGDSLEEWRSRVHPDDLERALEHVMPDPADPDKPYNIEFRMRHKDGRYVTILSRGFRLWDSEGHCSRMVGTHVDVTERRCQEEEIRRLRNYLGNVVDSMPSVLAGVDMDCRVVQWNREAERASGIGRENAVGREFKEVCRRFPGAVEDLGEAIRTGEAKSRSRVPYVRDGATRYADVTVFPLVDNGVEGAVVRIDDVTEQVNMEEIMIQSEKMLSVGGLATGMAHEINNPLAGIIQNAQVVRNRLDPELPVNRAAAESVGVDVNAVTAFMAKRGIPEMLDAIVDSGRRASRIVENMLSFGRKSSSTGAMHDLASLLDQVVELARNDYDLKKEYDFRKIEIIREYEVDVPKVSCEETKIQQVFLNLLKNGAQAMAGVTDAPCFHLRVMRDGGYVRVEIEDNGPGMDEQTRKRAFEPFFTTKRVGVGTGLGLSVSYFIVKEHHAGSMSVDSSPGAGARFIVRLPVKSEG